MMTGTSGRISLTLGSISSPVIPGMLMSERIRISDCSMVAAMRASASAAELAKSITKRCARRSRRNCWRNSASTSGSSSTTSTSTFTSDLVCATVLFHDDVVAHRKAKSGPFTGRLCRKERIEHLLLHLGRDTGTVVPNADLYGVSESPGRRSEDWLET